MVSSHVFLTPYSCKTNGPSGGHLVRYFTREGEFSPVHYLDRTSDKTKDYGDYVCGGVQHLPAWAENDPAIFFEAARAWEGGNRYYAFQVEFSLPRELNHEQQMALREDFMEAVMPDLPAMWVKHDKRLENGEMHPHMHILFSARKDDGIERGPEQMFKLWDVRVPQERRGAQKDLFWSKSQAPEQLRHAFADLTNYHLERAGAAERVDVRSLKRQEVYRRAIRRSHDERPDEGTKAREQAQAAASWEQRKVYKELGTLQAISREEFVLLVRAWTRDYPRGTAVERSSAAEVAAWETRELERQAQEIRRYEEDLARLDAAREIVARARRGEVVAQRDLLKALAARDAVMAGGGLKMSLTEERGYAR